MNDIEISKEKKLVILRLTREEDQFLVLNAEKNQKKGGKTAVLVEHILKNADTIPLKGDVKLRNIDTSARLPLSIIRFLKEKAKERGCSRATLICSCLSNNEDVNQV